eukprot:scaffold43926_cov71-Phaeocystis_antarctica.AAC.4
MRPRPCVVTTPPAPSPCSAGRCAASEGRAGESESTSRPHRGAADADALPADADAGAGADAPPGRAATRLSPRRAAHVSNAASVPCGACSALSAKAGWLPPTRHDSASSTAAPVLQQPLLGVRRLAQLDAAREALLRVAELPVGVPGAQVHADEDLVRLEAPQRGHQRAHQPRPGLHQPEGLALEHELARAEGGPAFHGASHERQHGAPSSPSRPGTEALGLGVGVLERLLLQQLEPDVRVRVGVGVGVAVGVGAGVKEPDVPVRCRAEEVQHLVGLAQHDAAAVAEAQRRDAAPRRRSRHALVVQHDLLLAPPRHRLRHSPLRRRAPPPVDAAPPGEVVARVEVARGVARTAGGRAVRLLAVGAGAVLRQPKVCGAARGERPAHQPHPPHARVAQPLPPEVRPVEHRDALEAGMQLRLFLQDELGAAALAIKDGRLPLDHACRVELGRQKCPVLLAYRQPCLGSLGPVGRQRASTLV